MNSFSCSLWLLGWHIYVINGRRLFPLDFFPRCVSPTHEKPRSDHWVRDTLEWEAVRRFAYFSQWRTKGSLVHIKFILLDSAVTLTALGRGFEFFRKLDRTVRTTMMWLHKRFSQLSFQVGMPGRSWPHHLTKWTFCLVQCDCNITLLALEYLKRKMPCEA